MKRGPAFVMFILVMLSVKVQVTHANPSAPIKIKPSVILPSNMLFQTATEVKFTRNQGGMYEY